MKNAPHEWDFLESAWRYALLLTGCAEGASKVFQESVAEVLRHPHADEPDRAINLVFSTVRRRGLRFPARSELSGSAASLHRLAEPGRSALSLLYLGALSAREIQQVLHLDERATREAIETARTALRAQTAPAS